MNIAWLDYVIGHPVPWQTVSMPLSKKRKVTPTGLSSTRSTQQLLKGCSSVSLKIIIEVFTVSHRTVLLVYEGYRTSSFPQASLGTGKTWGIKLPWPLITARRPHAFSPFLDHTNLNSWSLRPLRGPMGVTNSEDLIIYPCSSCFR